MATYIIKKGDTLTKIANRLGTTVQELTKKNNISNINKINIGQRLSYDNVKYDDSANYQSNYINKKVTINDVNNIINNYIKTENNIDYSTLGKHTYTDVFTVKDNTPNAYKKAAELTCDYLNSKLNSSPSKYKIDDYDLQIIANNIGTVKQTAKQTKLKLKNSAKKIETRQTKTDSAKTKTDSVTRTNTNSTNNKLSKRTTNSQYNSKSKEKSTFMDWFTNATLSAAMAENPAVATAVGYEKDPVTGKVTQDANWMDSKKRPDLVRLQKSIGTMGTLVTGATAAAATPAVVAGAPIMFRYGRLALNKKKKKILPRLENWLDEFMEHIINN